MQIANISHPTYRGKVTMIQAGTELEFYNNNALVEKRVCNSETEARTRFTDNVRFYTGRV